MTPEQIKTRCKEFLSVNMSKDGCIALPDEFYLRLSSLYREAMAKGLEMAADSAETVALLMEDNRWRERNVLTDHASVCREQANKLKEQA